jgi:hypothetical protein
MLTDIERKLLALALDSAAQPGEMTGAAVKLIEAWRRRNVRIEDFDRVAAITPRRERKFYKPDYGLCVMPWSQRYKGKQFKEIPPGWLKGQMDWIRSDPARSIKFAELATQIERFLAQ